MAQLSHQWLTPYEPPTQLIYDELNFGPDCFDLLQKENGREKVDGRRCGQAHQPEQPGPPAQQDRQCMFARLPKTSPISNLPFSQTLGVEPVDIRRAAQACFTPREGKAGQRNGETRVKPLFLFPSLERKKIISRKTARMPHRLL